MSEPKKYPVIVSKNGQVFYGTQWWEYPVDYPPTVQANGTTWLRQVWERQGWTVEDDDIGAVT